VGEREQLQKKVDQQARRMRLAEQDKPGLLAQTRLLGTLGLVLVLPVLAGAYLGHWLDTQVGAPTVYWTPTLLFLGLLFGIFNAYWLIRGS
jgi:ATP synthase protein I